MHVNSHVVPGRLFGLRVMPYSRLGIPAYEPVLYDSV